MSADNWALCPRCKEQRQKDVAVLHEKARTAYGNVPVEQFDEIRAAAEALEAQGDEGLWTFREDYELGVLEDGEFYVTYRGGCSKCSLSHGFKHSEQVMP